MSSDKKDLPPTEESIDANGIKTIISWKYNENKQLVKVTKRVQMVEVKEQILKRVAERRNIKPFNLPSGGNEGVTIQALEDIHMEKFEQVEKEEKPKEMSGGIICRYCKGNHMSMRCPYKDRFLEKKEEVKEPAFTKAAPVDGKYMPPALRRNTERTTEYKEEDEGYIVRIMNIAEDIPERQLKDMFREFHPTRFRLVTDYNTKKSRGFAFANFATKEDADRAIAAFNGYALNHLILSLSYSDKKKSTGPRYATGYGKALPQNVRR